MLTRRTFLAGAVIGAVAAPLAAQAQHDASVIRIAILGATRAEDLPALGA